MNIFYQIFYSVFHFGMYFSRLSLPSRFLSFTLQKNNNSLIIFYSATMSLDDCYEIGKILFNHDNLDYATPWFQEILKRLENSENPQIDPIEIIKFIIVAQEKGG